LAGRQSADRGAVAVEAALITPVLVLLVFGMIEFGLALKDWMAVSAAVRGGMRTAAAEPRVPGFADDTMKQVSAQVGGLNLSPSTWLVVYKATGSVAAPTLDASGAPVCTTCVTYQWDTATKAFVKRSDTWASTAQHACVGDTVRDSIGIYLTHKHDAVTGLFFSKLTLNDTAVAVLEPIPASQSSCS
jgi:hypothetical protein